MARGRPTRVLMTGGTGFVGGHLCPRIAAEWPEAHRVIVTRPGDPVTREGYATQALELTDRAAVDALVGREKPDLVLHLAAQSSVGAGARHEDTWRINAEATLHLASAIARHAPEATVFFVSSAEVYGRGFDEGLATEATKPQPMNAYARSKLSAEMMLSDVLAKDNALITARAFNHTGPGQDTRFVLPAFAAQISAIEAGRVAPKLMVGNLEAQRDFLDVRDVCDAYLTLLRGVTAGCRETVNVASGTAHRIGDLLAQMQALSTIAFDIVPDPERMRPSEIACSVGSPAKLVGMTDWAPNVPLSTTLRDVLDDQRFRAGVRLAS